MAFENNSRDDKDAFMDALDDNYFLDQNDQLKICLEESKIIIETLKRQKVQDISQKKMRQIL